MLDILDPPPKQEGGNPQWPLVKKCLGRYFSAGRVASAAFGYLEARMARSQSKLKDVNEAAVRRMLTWFIDQDAGESDPFAWMPVLPAVTFGEHSLALAPSAIYPVPGGYIVRKLWTAADFSIDRPYAAIAAAGYLTSAENALGVGTVRRVDFWHLRKRRQRSWRPSSLTFAQARLGNLLNDIAARISDTDDPAAA